MMDDYVMHAHDLNLCPQYGLTEIPCPALMLDPAVLMQTQKSPTRYTLISPSGGNQQVWAPGSPFKWNSAFN